MSAPIELPASVAASGIPAADVPREIRQLVTAIRAAVGPSPERRAAPGTEAHDVPAPADLRLPLDPEYIGEGFAVLAELREQLAKISRRSRRH